MSLFPTFPVLFLAFLIAGTSSARASTEELKSDDLKSYWKSATNNQPLPEALKDLIPSEVADNHFSEEFEKDPNMVHPDYLRYKNGHSSMVHPDYLRYKNDPNMVRPDYLGYKNDPNMMHPDYLRYKNDPNMIRPDYLGYKNDPNIESPNYFRYKNNPNIAHLNYLRYKNNPNMVGTNYLGYKGDSRLNNVDVEGAVTLQSDPTGVNLDYLRYKNDLINMLPDYLLYRNDPNMARPDYLGYKNDPNMVRPDYLGYKNDPNMARPDYLGYKNDPNKVRPDYLGYKNDLNMARPDYLGYKNDPNMARPDYLGYKNDPNMARPDYLRYKNDPTVVHPDYLRYKNDQNMVRPNYLRYKNNPNRVSLDYLRYKKDSTLNNADPEVSVMFKKDRKRVNLDYLRYKKDSLSAKVEYGKLLVFTPPDLQVGKKFLTVFPRVHSSSDSQFASPRFMPRHVADSIPFSSARLSDIMERYGIQPDSPWAKSMEETLTSCEGKETMGETLFCSTSLESMLDSVRKTIGPNYEINFISTVHLSNPISNIETPQKYTLLEAPKEIEAPKKLNCHPMTYLYPIFGCHSVKDTKLYRLSLEGEDKSKVDAVAVCHMDTSDWSADALFLLAAGLKPGDGAVCHFMQPSHFSIYASTKGA